jgi:pimeloyl-ACP methyl ester carboxylesterase
MAVTPFTIDVPDHDLAALADRLARTRLPDAVTDGGWSYGADRAFMRDLTAYWRDSFDWRAQEAKLNRLPQFTADVDGNEIHFVHARGKGPKPLPLLITHGWPSSFAEFAKIIPLLTDPAAHGGRAEDSFDVIAPSLPGFGFSAHPTTSGMTSAAVTTLWVTLMTGVLGYDRFVAQGGDIGGGITNRLGRNHAEHVIAIHAMVAPPLGREEITDPTDAEKAFIALQAEWEREEGAYGHQQRTRPQSLAFGLNDSPVGLAAWIVEKWRAWSDCGGDILSRFTMDELLTTISIYWFTQSIGSSMRMYYETAHGQEPRPAHKIAVPARIFLTREAVDLCPPEYAARSYVNFSYGVAERGGHFLAAEEPELLAKDIREAFRPYR